MSKIRRMLNKCASGYSIEKKKHRQWVRYNGKTYKTQRTLTLANPAFRPMFIASYDRTDSRTVCALPFQLGAPAS